MRWAKPDREKAVLAAAFGLALLHGPAAARGIEASPPAQHEASSMSAPADATPSPPWTAPGANSPAIEAAPAQSTTAQSEPAAQADAQAEAQDAIVVSGRRKDPADPFAHLNAQSFAMTDAVDDAVAGPVARGYKRTIPEPVRNGIRNLFANLRQPVVLLNFMLQHKIGKATETLARFTVNTTVGAAGLFDIAKRKPFHLPARPNSFADTLGFYGVKQGAFFYVPLLGPTTVRDLAGGLIDKLVLPVGVKLPFNGMAFNASATALRGLEHRSEIDGRLTALRKDPDSKYVATREFYLARRQAEIDHLRGTGSPRLAADTANAAD